MPIDKHIINANLEAEGVVNAQLDKSGYTEDETSVMAGKAAIAASITNKGVPADKTDSFHQLSEKVSRITTGEGEASALNDLTDVEISTPTSGQILKYDEENDKWVNSEEFLAPAIYSTDEREVGVWTDGKPLYQKTYRYSNTVYADTNNIIGNIGTNIDTLIFINRTVRNSSNTRYSCYENSSVDSSLIGFVFEKTTGDIAVKSNVTWSSPVIICTIQYTKTTDTPGSGTWTPSGIPAVHYDGNEKVIGTWFGETLYEKTFELSDELLIQGNTWTEIPFPTANISGLISVCGNGYNHNKINVFEFMGATADDGDYVKVLQTRNAGIRVKYITLRYTKTT